MPAKEKDIKPRFITLDSVEGYQRVLNSREFTFGMHSGRVVLPPGGEVGTHNTEANEEAIIVLAGRGTVMIDGEPAGEIEEGMVAYVPPHTSHNIINRSEALLKYLYVVAPARMEDE